MTLSALASEWLEKANEEELFSRSILTHHDAPAWGVGFHSQQLAEKSLKAYLVAQQGEFPKIHQLDHLIALCARHDSAFNKLAEDAQRINSYYFEDRYPGPRLPTTWEEAEEAFASGQRISKLVHTKLKQ